MNKVYLILVVLAMSGCAQIKSMIPSFSDPLQSQRIIDARAKIYEFDCAQPQRPQITEVRRDLQWFELYSESRGWRQDDVRSIVKPIRSTVEDFYKRVQEKDASTAYCQIKVQVLKVEIDRASTAILGRF